VSDAVEREAAAEAAPPERQRPGVSLSGPLSGFDPIQAQLLGLQGTAGNHAVNRLLRSAAGARILGRRRLPEPKDIAALETTSAGGKSADAAAAEKGAWRLLVLAQEQLTQDQKDDFAVRIYTAMPIADWRKKSVAEQNSLVKAGEARYKAMSPADQIAAQTAALSAVRPDLVLGDPKLIDTGPRPGSADAANIQKLVDNANKVFAEIAGGKRDGDLKDVFGPGSVKEAKRRYHNGRDWMNRLQAAKKVLTDRSGYSGEVGQGGLTGHFEVIRLHPKFIDQPDEGESVVTMIHESMHAGNLDVGDKGYISQPNFEHLSTAKKLTNAAHFEVVPRRILNTAKFQFTGVVFTPLADASSTGSGPKLTPKQQAITDATNMYREAWALGLNLHLLFVRVYKNPAAWDTTNIAGEFGLPASTHFADVLPFWSKVMGLTMHARTTIDSKSTDPSKAPVSVVDVALSEGVVRKLSRGQNSVPKTPTDADKLEHDGATVAEIGAISTVADERDLLIRLVRRKVINSVTGGSEDDDLKVVKTMGTAGDTWAKILQKRPPTAFPASVDETSVGPAPPAAPDIQTSPDSTGGSDGKGLIRPEDLGEDEDVPAVAGL
jgi:hypothetical protein